MSERKLELAQYVNFVKEEIKKTEEEKKGAGFWISVKSVEVELEAMTVLDSEGVPKIHVLFDATQKSESSIQRIKIGFVGQYSPPVEASGRRTDTYERGFDRGRTRFGDRDRYRRRSDSSEGGFDRRRGGSFDNRFDRRRDSPRDRSEERV